MVWVSFLHHISFYFTECFTIKMYWSSPKVIQNSIGQGIMCFVTMLEASYEVRSSSKSAFDVSDFSMSIEKVKFILPWIQQSNINIFPWYFTTLIAVVLHRQEKSKTPKEKNKNFKYKGSSEIKLYLQYQSGNVGCNQVLLSLSIFHESEDIDRMWDDLRWLSLYTST